MIHKDCFAYSEKPKVRCTALKELNCGGYAFYKPSVKKADKLETVLSAAAVSRHEISDETKDEIVELRRKGVKLQIIASKTGVSMSYMQKILKDRLTDEERQTLRRPKSARKN